MLRAAGVAFETVASGFDEAGLKRRWLDEGASPATLAERLAEAKAVAAPAGPNDLVVGADSTIELDGRLLDKPANAGEAREHLQRLRGRAHDLYSATAIVRSGETLWRGRERARLNMRAFSDAFLDDYLERMGEKVLASVGCYELEGLGAQIFEAVEGDYFTILGLPLLPLLGALRSLGALAE